MIALGHTATRAVGKTMFTGQHHIPTDTRHRTHMATATNKYVTTPLAAQMLTGCLDGVLEPLCAGGSGGSAVSHVSSDAALSEGDTIKKLRCTTKPDGGCFQ